MNAIEQVWNISDFYGGESDGFYNGTAGSYRAGTGLDTRRVENGARACNKLTDTTNTYIGSVLAVSPFGSLVFSTRDSNTGKIYSGGAFKFNMATGTISYDLIYGFGKMKKTSDGIEYQYGFSATNFGVGKVTRFDVNFGGCSHLGTYTLANGRTANPTGNKLPVLSLPGRIVFAWANTVFQIDGTETITELISFPIDYEIQAIVYYQDVFKIYYNHYKDTNGPVDSYIAYWDGTNDFVSQYVKYENSPIVTVANDGPNDYVVFGSTYVSDLYIVQGLIRTSIRNNIEYSTGNTRVLTRESMVNEGIFYCTGTNKLGSNCLYSMGSYYPGTPNTLVPENTFTDSSPKMSTNGQTFYFWDNNKIYSRSQLFGSEAGASFKLYTLPLRGNAGFYTKKSLQRIDISYRLSSSFDSLKLYIRTAGGPYVANTSGWTLARTITGATDYAKMGCRIDFPELTALGIGDFNQLEYYVEGTNASTDSCILHQIKTTYLDYLFD